MTESKLQEAVALIRSGGRQNGQRLLGEVLAGDPGNELAWLWMSGLVSGDKQRYCLQKAQSLNPENAQTRQLLAKLTPPPPADPMPQDVPAAVVLEPGLQSQPEDDPELSAAQ